MKAMHDQLLIHQFLSKHPEQAVEVIERMTIEDIVKLMQELATGSAQIILSNLTPYQAGKVIARMPLERTNAIVGTMPTRVTEAILRTMPKANQGELLDSLPDELGKYLRNSLSYKKNQVGSLVEAGILTLPEDTIVGKALEIIKDTKALTKPVLFVLDAESKLAGYVKVNDLLTTDTKKSITGVTRQVAQPLIAHMLIKDALDRWDDSLAELPVVKGNGHFIGVASRATLSKQATITTRTSKLEVKTGNALGDLYLIGLTSLLGSPDEPSKS